MNPSYTTTQVIDILNRYDAYIEARAAKEDADNRQESANALLAAVKISPDEIDFAIRIKSTL
jgi:hypothetical protein